MDQCLRNFISEHWGSQDSSRFPGPQPVSIERRHFTNLKSQPYFVCEKNDGVRNMLVCFEWETKKYCVLVDRAFHIRTTTLTVPRGTILDGELMPDDTFLVYDAILVRGENVMNRPLDERLKFAKSICVGILKTPKNPVVRVKTMYPLDEVEKVIGSLSDTTDGIIFTPVKEPVRMGTHETLFKWKPRKHITIDFIVLATGEFIDRGFRGHEAVYGLYIAERERYIYVMPCKNGSMYENQIVECMYGETGWEIIKVRSDKTYPNNKRTYERTLVNLREDIQPQEFLCL